MKIRFRDKSEDTFKIWSTDILRRWSFYYRTKKNNNKIDNKDYERIREHLYR